MSDRTWETTADPEVVLAHVADSLTDRTSRLVAAGFLHTVAHLVRTARSRAFLQKFDEYAAGALTRDELATFRYATEPTQWEPHDEGPIGRLLWEGGFPHVGLAEVSRLVALAAGAGAAGHATGDTSPGAPWHVAFQAAWFRARAVNADVVRCAVPPPERTVPFESAWRTSTVRGVAAQARATGDYGGMPILADALQDAGCADEELLAHLRNARGHHACCWGVRVVLDGVT
jgi:hypothetical protein